MNNVEAFWEKNPMCFVCHFLLPVDGVAGNSGSCGGGSGSGGAYIGPFVL